MFSLTSKKFVYDKNEYLCQRTFTFLENGRLTFFNFAFPVLDENMNIYFKSFC
jgi:hypothetical protein